MTYFNYFVLRNLFKSSFIKGLPSDSRNSNLGLDGFMLI